MENCDPEVFVSHELFEKLDSLINVYKSIISYINALLSELKVDVLYADRRYTSGLWCDFSLR